MGGGCGFVYGILVAACCGDTHGVIRGIGIVYGLGEVRPSVGQSESLTGWLQWLESFIAIIQCVNAATVESALR